MFTGWLNGLETEAWPTPPSRSKLKTSKHATCASAGQEIDWALEALQPHRTNTRLIAKAFSVDEARKNDSVRQSANIVKCFIDLDLIKQFVWLVFDNPQF
jgi:hypothetical protein